jgi:two-component system, OmpR family, sensor kinase
MLARPRGGRIEVTLERQDGFAVLQVKDNGPGIALDALEHIFDRFYRGDPAREGSGTGLELALVRSIVQLHHGQIRVSSKSGRGSCFRVTLPLAAGPAGRLINSNLTLILLSSL